MFYGVLIDRAQYRQGAFDYGATPEWSSCVKQLNDTKAIMFMPHTYHNFRSFRSQLDADDIKRGHVLAEKIFRLRQKRDPTLIPDHLTVTATDHTGLLELIQVTGSTAIPGWYYLEMEWFLSLPELGITVETPLEIR